MRSLAAIQRRMCTNKIAFDYTVALPAHLLNASRSCDSYLCPFCGWAHFTKLADHRTSGGRRGIKWNRRFIEHMLLMKGGKEVQLHLLYCFHNLHCYNLLD